MSAPEDDTAGRSGAGWHPDPTRRFDLRYHNGVDWTADVSNDGDRFVDPAGSRPSAVTTLGAGEVANPIATASMVLGIVAIGIGWLPFVVVLGAIAAILAVLFGIIGRRRARVLGVGTGFATTGIITGAVGLLACVGGVLFTISLTRAIDRFDQPSAHEVEITSCVRSGSEITATGTITNTGAETASFTVRVYFVRPGTDNPRRQGNVLIDDLSADATEEFDLTVNAADLDLDCIVGAVRGPLPYGVDPGT